MSFQDETYPGPHNRNTGLSETSPPSAERMHSLDALRAFALLGVIFGHAAMSFAVKCPPGWAACDRSKSFLFDLFIFIIAGFAMQVFFVMAGYFSQLLLNRKGLLGFAQNRYKRIVIPFILSLIVIVPVMQIVGLYGSARKAAARAAEHPGFEASVIDFFTTRKYFDYFTLGHLWFLWYLILLYTALLLAARLMGRLPALIYFDKGFAALVNSPFKPFLFAIPTIAFMWPMSFMIDTPLRILPEWHIFAFYAFFFCVGMMLSRQPQVFGMKKTYWRPYLLLAFFIFLPLTLGMIMKATGTERMKDSNFYVAAIVFCATYTWLMIFGLIGLFNRYASRPKAAIWYLSEASFWVYLIHFPLVLLMQIIVKDLKQPAFLKFSFVFCVSVIILFGSYELFVRRTFVGEILSGKRQTGKRVLPNTVVPAKWHEVLIECG